MFPFIFGQVLHLVLCANRIFYAAVPENWRRYRILKICGFSGDFTVLTALSYGSRRAKATHSPTISHIVAVSVVSALHRTLSTYASVPLLSTFA